MLNAKTDTNRREGFWRSSMEPDLPLPTPSTDWSGASHFLKALGIVETKAKARRFRGLSACRICNRGNGNTTFELNGWEWPSGLAHYVSEHRVKPSDDFIAFVVAETSDDVATPTAAIAAPVAAPAGIPTNDAETIAALRQDTPLNRARAQFSHAYGRIEQSGMQRRPATIIEMRRMEFEAIEAIVKALGLQIPSE